MTLADGSTINKHLRSKEIIAKKDGYYLVELRVPNSDVKEYDIQIEVGIV